MNDYLLGLYNNLGGEAKLGKQEDFFNLITTNKEYRDGFYNNIGGEKVLGRKDDFDYMVTGGNFSPELSEENAMYELSNRAVNWLGNTIVGGSQMLWQTIIGMMNTSAEQEKMRSFGRYVKPDIQEEKVKQLEAFQKDVFFTSREGTKLIEETFSEQGPIPLMKDKYAEDFDTKVFRGLGTVGGFMALGTLTGYAGVPGGLSAGVFGAMSEGEAFAEQMYDMAIQDGRTEEEAYKIAQSYARPIGTGLGALEAFGIEAIAPGKLVRAGKKLDEGIVPGSKSLLAKIFESKGNAFRNSLSGRLQRNLSYTFKKLLPTMGKEMLEETTQEMAQTFGEEVSQDLLLGKPIDWERVKNNTLEAGSIAAILGGGVSGITTAIAKPSDKKINKFRKKYGEAVLNAIGENITDKDVKAKILKVMDDAIVEEMGADLEKNRNELYATSVFSNLLHSSKGQLNEQEQARFDKIVKEAGTELNETSRILLKGAIINESVKPELRKLLLDGNNKLFGIDWSELNKVQQEIDKILPKSYANKIKKIVRDKTGQKRTKPISYYEYLYDLNLNNLKASDKIEDKAKNYNVSHTAKVMGFTNLEDYNEYLKLKNDEIFSVLYKVVQPYTTRVTEKFISDKITAYRTGASQAIKDFSKKNPIKSKWKDIQLDYEDEVLWFAYNNTEKKESKEAFKQLLEARGVDIYEIKQPTKQEVKPATEQVSVEKKEGTTKVVQKPTVPEEDNLPPIIEGAPEGTAAASGEEEFEKIFNEQLAILRGEQEKNTPPVAKTETNKPEGTNDVVDKYSMPATEVFNGQMSVAEVNKITGRFKGKSSLVNDIYDLADNVPVIFVKEGKELAKLDLANKFGIYSNGKIYINGNVDWLGNGGLLQKVLFHEVSHYATVEAIDKSPELQAELDALMAEVSKLIDESTMTEGEKADSKYFLKDRKEFVAGILSDTTILSKYLDKVDYKPKLSMRQRVIEFFKKAISTLLGKEYSPSAIDLLLKDVIAKPTGTSTKSYSMPTEWSPRAVLFGLVPTIDVIQATKALKGKSLELFNKNLEKFIADNPDIQGKDNAVEAFARRSIAADLMGSIIKEELNINDYDNLIAKLDLYDAIIVEFKSETTIPPSNGEIQATNVVTPENTDNELDKELDLYQSVNSDDENQTLRGTKLITEAFAEVFGFELKAGQAPQEFLQTLSFEEFDSFRKALIGESSSSYLEVVNSEALRVLINRLKLGYNHIHKYTKKLSYNKYVKGLMLNVWNNAKSEVYYETLNVGLDKSGFTHLVIMDGYFYDPDGKIKTNYRKKLKGTDDLPALQTILGDNTLSFSILNGFLVEDNGTVLVKHLDNLTSSNIYGRATTNARITVEQLQTALIASGYIFTNKYGDKATLTAIKTSLTIDQLIAAITPIYQTYMQANEAYIRENNLQGYGNYTEETNESKIANVVRIIQDELKMGNTIQNILAGQFATIGLNFSETMKRSFIGSETTYWEQDYNVINDVELTTEEGQKEKLKRFRKGTNGQYNNDEDIFIDDETNEVMISTGFLSENITPEKLGVNDIGLSIFDGASLYIIGRLDRLTTDMSGSFNSGHVKDWVGFIPEILGKAIYLKHAKHGISFRDSLGQYLRANKIGMLSSITSEKLKSIPIEMQITFEDLQNGNAKNKRIYIPLKSFNRIKETKEVKTYVKGFGQFFAAASKANPFLSKADKENVWTSVVDDFLRKLNKYFEDKAISDFSTKSIINDILSFGVYAENKHSKSLFDLVERIISVTPKERLQETIGPLLNHPFYAKYINSLIDKSIRNLLKYEMPGGMPVNSPDGGNLFSSRVDKVRRTIRQHILESQEIDAEDMFEYLSRVGKTQDSVQKVKDILKIPVSIANAKALLEKYQYAVSYGIDFDDMVLSEEVEARYKEKIEEIEEDIEKLNIRYQENAEILNLIKNSQNVQNLTEKLMKQILRPDGRLQWGYAMVDKSTAKRLGIRAFGKIITSITPADSLASAMGHTVVGILEDDQIEAGSIVLSSEYIQLQGKDFDIDVVSIITQDLLSSKEFNRLFNIVKEIPMQYVNDAYNRYVKNGIVPEGAETFEQKAILINAKDEEGLTPHTKFLRDKLFGSPMAFNAYKFRPYGKEAGYLGDIYFKDVGYISTIRTYQGIMSSLGITSSVANQAIDVNKFYDVGHQTFKQITNNEVDFPKDTSKFFYNDSKSGIYALLLGFHPLNYNQPLVLAIESINKRLFNDMIQLPRERKYESLPETVKKIERARTILNLLMTDKFKLRDMIVQEIDEQIKKTRKYDAKDILKYEREIAYTYLTNMKFFGKDKVETIDNALLKNILSLDLNKLVPEYGVNAQAFNTIEIANAKQMVKTLPLEMQNAVDKAVNDLFASYKTNMNLLVSKSIISALYDVSANRSKSSHLAYIRELLTEIVKPRFEIKTVPSSVHPIVADIRAETYPMILKEIFKSPILTRSTVDYHDTDIPYLENLGYSYIEGNIKDFRLDYGGKEYTIRLEHKNGVLYYKNTPVYAISSDIDAYKVLTELLWKDPKFGRANRLQISRMINMFDKAAFSNDKRMKIVTSIVTAKLAAKEISYNDLAFIYTSLIVNPLAGNKVQSFHKGTDDSNSLLLLLAKDTHPDWLDNYIKSFTKTYEQVYVKDRNDDSYGLPIFKESKRNQTNISTDIINDFTNIKGSFSELMNFKKLIDKSIPEAITYLQLYAGELEIDMLKSMGLIGDRHLKYIFDIIRDTNEGELTYRLKLNLDTLLIKNNIKPAANLTDTTIKENLLSLFFIINKVKRFSEDGISKPSLFFYRHFLTPEALPIAHGIKDKTRHSTMDRLLPNFHTNGEEVVKAKQIAETNLPFASRGTTEAFGDVEEELYVEQRLQETVQSVDRQLMGLHIQAQKYHDEILELMKERQVEEEASTLEGKKLQEDIFNFTEYGFKNDKFKSLSISQRVDGVYEYIVNGISFTIEEIGEYYYPINKNQYDVDLNERERRVFTAALSYRTLLSYEVPRVLGRTRVYIDHIVDKIRLLNNRPLYSKAIKIQNDYAKIIKAIELSNRDPERDYVPHSYQREEFEIDFYRQYYEKYRAAAIRLLEEKGYDVSPKNINLLTQKILTEELARLIKYSTTGDGLFNANWQMRISESNNYLRDDPRVFVSYIKRLVSNLESDISALGAYYYFAKAQKKGESASVIEYMKEHFAGTSVNKYLHLHQYKKDKIQTGDEIEFTTTLTEPKTGVQVEGEVFGRVIEVNNETITVEAKNNTVTLKLKDIYTYDVQGNKLYTSVQKFRYADSVKYLEYLLIQGGLDNSKMRKAFTLTYTKSMRFANAALGWTMLGGIVQFISRFNNKLGGKFTNFTYSRGAYKLMPVFGKPSIENRGEDVIGNITKKIHDNYSSLTKEELAIFEGLKALSINDLRISIDLLTRGEYDIDEFGVNWNTTAQVRDLYTAWRQKTGYDEFITEKKRILLELSRTEPGSPEQATLFDELQVLKNKRKELLDAILDTDKAKKLNDELQLTTKEARSLLYQVIKGGIDKWSFKYFNEPEKALRTVAFFLKYYEAISVYGVSVEDAVEMAKTGTKDLQVLYAAKDRPPAANTVIGKILAKFAQYRVSRLVTQYKEFRQLLKQIYIYGDRAFNPFRPFITSSEKMKTEKTSLKTGKAETVASTINLERSAMNVLARQATLNLLLWHLDNILFMGVMKFGSPFWTFFFEVIKTFLAAIDGKDDDDDFTLETPRGRIEAVQLIPFLGWGFSTMIQTGMTVAAGKGEQIPSDLLKGTRTISQGSKAGKWMSGEGQYGIDNIFGIFLRSQKENTILDYSIPFYKNIKKMFK